jgi:1,4-alpha-glucan branching enzyme
MGREFAWDRCVPWAEAAEPDRAGITAFLRAALQLYRREPALHASDDERSGFVWVDCENRKESVAAFLRTAPGARAILVVVNFTPVVRTSYPLRVPSLGTWRELLNSDEVRFGGSGALTGEANADPQEGGDGSPAGIRVTMPPFGIAYFALVEAGFPGMNAAQ